MTRFSRAVLLSASIAALSLGFSSAAQASVVFTFADTGAGVTMTSSGTLDTSKLVSFAASGWGGTGIETNSSGQTDIMGGTSFGSVNTAFRFSAGTDHSPWVNPGGPFNSSVFSFGVTSGSKSFTTYVLESGIRIPGMGLRSQDLVGALWTPDQSWLSAGATIASLNMVSGTFTISDALTQESITIQVGELVGVPAPASLPLLAAGLGLLGGYVARRRKAR